MVFVSRVPLRWVDLDAQGHANNALLADYLQEARVEWLLSGPNAHLLGTSTMVVGHQLEYLGPVNYRVEPIEVRLSVGAVGASRFSLGYTAHQDDRLVARGRSTMCVFDYAADRLRRLTSAERSWFLAQSGELDALPSLGRWQVGTDAHLHDVVVRWSDLDRYGHVNNVRVFDYVAEARIRMNPGSDAQTRMHDAQAAGITWLVARQDVDYLGQINHRGEPYQVRSAIARLGTTSVTIVAEVTDPADGRTLARTLTVLVSADASGRPIGVPEGMRHAAELWPAVTSSRA